MSRQCLHPIPVRFLMIGLLFEVRDGESYSSLHPLMGYKTAIVQYL